MRRAFVPSVAACAMALVALVTVSSPAFAAEQVVKGEVITIMCYQGHGLKGTGQAHLACSISCAKKGYPLGILTSGGSYYRIDGPLTAHDNVQLQKYLASQVEAHGTVARVGGKRIITIAAASDIIVRK
ncbi:MAG TPA: hypothetical protein VNE16_04715 [Vicinamibacterales bacterium]|nr:hypothetical protein [Vicinamibacterales bacterium]